MRDSFRESGRFGASVETGAARDRRGPGCRAVALAAVLALGVSPLRAAEEDETFRLTLDAPVATWDEGIPLGNGMLGGLLWGDGNGVNLSLDRGDLWDETVPPEIREGNWTFADMLRLRRENYGEMIRRYDGTYNHPAPTKLPGGRLVLTLGEGRRAEIFSLDMKRAVGTVRYADGGLLECLFHATERVALIRVDDVGVTSRFIRPDGLNRLGYEPAGFGGGPDESWMVQEAADGLVYGIVTAIRRGPKESVLAVAIATNREDPTVPDPLALARSRVESCLARGFAEMRRSHEQWWDAFWSTSDVVVPDERLRRHYNLVKYFYGAASRPEAPSMPLQAVWTQDSGGLPPWKGDFHHDLNTQMTYLPYHTAGLTDSGLSFINHMWELLPVYRRFAREFYGVDGAAVPAVMTLRGNPLGGWPQYSLSPTYGIWIGQSFHLHWKHTMDEAFLRDRAYPWLSEVVGAVVQLMEERDDKLYLPMSSSSEIHDASPQAFLTPNSNQDLAQLQWGFAALAEMAEALGRADDAARWRALGAKLDGPHTDADDVLMFSADEPFNQSHRHHAHAMAIHPFGLLTVDGSARDRRIVNATLDRMIALGTGAWTGYSFSWFACLLARAGRGEEAFEYLTDYERAFTLRNGFHVNGDQIGSGLSGFSYRPFTLEGNFLAMEAMHDMLLQSWPPDPRTDPTPVVRLFPAVPWRWARAEFRGLRAQGGFSVSARRENGATTAFEIRATVDGVLRLRDTFGDRPPELSRAVRRDGRDFVVQLQAGDVLTGNVDAPAARSAEPALSREITARLARIEALHESRSLKIASTAVPLRIGGDSNGQNGFVGEIARVGVFDRVLTPEEIAGLARADGPHPAEVPGCVVGYDFAELTDGVFRSLGSRDLPARPVGEVDTADAGPLGRVLRLDGTGFLSVEHDPALNCNRGVTVVARIRLRHGDAPCFRIIDKSVAGTANGYDLDIYLGRLRLISRARAANPVSAEPVPVGEWVHVAGTVDGVSGAVAMYINGSRAAMRE